MSFSRPNTKINLKGCFSSNCPNGQTTEINWTADKLYYMDGAEYCISGNHYGVKITFEVHHPTAGLLDRFVDGIYAFDHHHYEFYHATIPAGLIIKVKVENNTGADIHFYGNLYLHVDK